MPSARKIVLHRATPSSQGWQRYTVEGWPELYVEAQWDDPESTAVDRYPAQHLWAWAVRDRRFSALDRERRMFCPFIATRLSEVRVWFGTHGPAAHDGAATALLAARAEQMRQRV